MPNAFDIAVSIVAPLVFLAFLCILIARIWMASRTQRKQRSEWMIEVRRQSDAMERIAAALEKTNGQS